MSGLGSAVNAVLRALPAVECSAVTPECCYCARGTTKPIAEISAAGAVLRVFCSGTEAIRLLVRFRDCIWITKYTCNSCIIEGRRVAYSTSLVMLHRTPRVIDSTQPWTNRRLCQAAISCDIFQTASPRMRGHLKRTRPVRSGPHRFSTRLKAWRPPN